MKDRIRALMESQHMTQQTFAEFIGISPATLSSIFNGRTRPTIPVVDAIKLKVKNINADWLMWGDGPMFKDSNGAPEALPVIATAPQPASAPSGYGSLFDNPVAEQPVKVVVKTAEPPRPMRQITEIRVFYSDQTWETFIPKNK